ncbi:complement C1q-like protein 2 [Labrus mixtus]|uniref:complement C1q-like protein 2 n=1 Tax=Labrus mixtus TaxID=508554 RepID=UPI0029C0EC24|nr:complement C1q-like protein 2 [Labrus mixtus]
MRALILLCLLHSALGVRYSWHPETKEQRNECLEDQGSCGCCKTLREIERMGTYFNTRLTELEEEYEQTKQTFTDTKANRTAFSVALFEDGPFKCYGPFANEQPVIFKKVFLNLGNGYNPNNGTFIVPHSGVYSLAFTVYSDAGSPNSKLAACAKLLVNGEIIVGSTDINKHDQEDSSSNVLVLHLNRSDQVTLSLSPGCFLCDDGYHYNTFSAFLLYVPDCDREMY